MPEIRGRGFKFHGRMKSFRHGLRATDHFAGDALFGSGMFEHQPGLKWQALLQDEQRAVVTDADGGGLESQGLALQRNMDAGPHAQEDALAATALVAGYACR